MKTLEELSLSEYIAVIDIETTDTAITSKICSIAAVIKNIVTGDEEDVFYQRVEWQGDHQKWRTESFDTLNWHKRLGKQENKQAYNELYNAENREPLPIALIGMAEFVTNWTETNTKLQVFGNGCEFDNAILLHAMEQYHIKAPWHFAGNQSLRTIVWMGRVLLGIDPKYSKTDDGFVAHHALHDARHEADYLFKILQAFRESIGEQ